MSKITIFGLAGTGKTTAGKILASKLGYEYMSSGNIFRSYADELGLSLNEFEELSKTYDKYDKKLDDTVSEYGRTHDNFIFESRLAWHFIPDSFKISLVCDFEERIKRVANRENKSIDQVRDETIHREDLIRKRYSDYYGINNFDDNLNFDFVVDTVPNNAEMVVELILNELKNRGLIK
jgi:cytidylate kinase